MKTLDEVIFEAPYSQTPWEADALHYLKVLKDILDPLNVKKISHEITCPQCNSVIAILLPESNEPLTWDELREMEGKPVWVEIIGRTIPLDSSWGIATGGSYHTWQGVESWTLVRPGAEYSLPVADYGKTWQAYRKERK